MKITQRFYVRLTLAALTVLAVAYVLTATAVAADPSSTRPAATQPAGSVVVRVTDLRNADGKVVIGIWRSAEGFPKDGSKTVQKAAVDIADGKATTTFAGLPPGQYAVAAFHDENDNGRVDLDDTGRPTEGVCGSNDSLDKDAPPSFDACHFDVGTTEKTVTLKMKY